MAHALDSLMSEGGKKARAKVVSYKAVVVPHPVKDGAEGETVPVLKVLPVMSDGTFGKIGLWVWLDDATQVRALDASLAGIQQVLRTVDDKMVTAKAWPARPAKTAAAAPKAPAAPAAKPAGPLDDMFSDLPA